jgi:hypothetical protein
VATGAQLEPSRTITAAIGLFILAALVTPGFASCAFVEPEVGKFRGSCKGASGEYARPDGYTTGQPDPRCVPDQDDDECEVCEDTHCCSTRFGCYDHDACACADEEFDECLEHIADPSTEEGVAATAHCWEEFSGSGPLAKARVDCQREFCKEACGVP